MAFFIFILPKKSARVVSSTSWVFQATEHIRQRIYGILLQEKPLSPGQRLHHVAEWCMAGPNSLGEPHYLQAVFPQREQVLLVSLSNSSVHLQQNPKYPTSALPALSPPLSAWISNLFTCKPLTYTPVTPYISHTLHICLSHKSSFVRNFQLN